MGFFACCRGEWRVVTSGLMGNKVRICFHNRCFDGASSAAVFSRFYRECINSQAELHYTGLTHRPAGLFDEVPFDGDENIIVDFKYSSSPRLTWWFDHHQSAFLTPEDEEHFRRDTGKQKFYDPTYKSCTKFLATVARERFGFHPEPLAELIHWADIIDGAQYETPEVAVKMNVPATQIALVIEASSDEGMTTRLIPHLASKPLEEIARLDFIADNFQPLYQLHQKSMEILRRECQFERGVVYYDLTGYDLEGFNKFIPYYQYPDCIFSVSICASPQRIKVGVGSNPWHDLKDGKNLAEICERYGGGGHARVAAISFDPKDLEKARQAAREITEELRR